MAYKNTPIMGIFLPEKAGVETKPSRPRIKGEDKSFYFYDYDNNLFELHTGNLQERLKAYTAKE